MEASERYVQLVELAFLGFEGEVVPLAFVVQLALAGLTDLNRCCLLDHLVPRTDAGPRPPQVRSAVRQVRVDVYEKRKIVGEAGEEDWPVGGSYPSPEAGCFFLAEVFEGHTRFLEERQQEQVWDTCGQVGEDP